jgi:predicted RNase H-like HicB family nuclease
MSNPNQNQKFTIYTKPHPEGGYTAHCNEPPIYCHAQTREEALKKLKEAIESLGWKLNPTN